MGNKQDFVIKDGVLKKYTGFDGDVTIPEGITEIGREAFDDCTCLTCVTILVGWETVNKHLFEASRPVLVAPHISIAKFDKENKPSACVGFARRIRTAGRWMRRSKRAISSTSSARGSGFSLRPFSMRNCCG